MKEDYTPAQVKETMEKFGFVYADLSLERANAKYDEYEKMGFSPKVLHKPDGFYVTIQDIEE